VYRTRHRRQALLIIEGPRRAMRRWQATTAQRSMAAAAHEKARLHAWVSRWGYEAQEGRWRHCWVVWRALTIPTARHRNQSRRKAVREGWEALKRHLEVRNDESLCMMRASLASWKRCSALLGDALCRWQGVACDGLSKRTAAQVWQQSVKERAFWRLNRMRWKQRAQNQRWKVIRRHHLARWLTLWQYSSAMETNEHKILSQACDTYAKRRLLVAWQRIRHTCKHLV